MSFSKAVDARVVELGKHVLSMTTAAGSGHPSSALSILHAVVTLMRRVMRFDPQDPWNPANDRLVLSEGHAVPAVYAAYADLGGVVGPRERARALTLDDLNTLRDLASPLDGHPNPAEGFPFFDAATGSLGQGLSVAAGLALAARLDRSPRRIFVIMGDGESREGQIWEAADFIVDHRLAAVTALFNCNGQGQADLVSRQQSADALARKMAAFGWETRVIDGHNADEIVAACAPAGDKPVAIIARTEKGWGVELLKDKSNHGKPLAAEALPRAAAQLDETAARRGATVRVELAAPTAPPRSAVAAGPALTPTPFAAAMQKAGLASAVEKNKCATRRAYGAALLALGAADPRVVAFDGDVSNSTFSEMFGKAFPDRFFECKIAEQNMISAAAGAAAAGKIPFANSFAKFISRGYDQIEMAQITRANIKIVGSHSGVSLAADGPSQMSLHDVAYFRCAAHADAAAYGERRRGPICVSFQPADAVAAYACTWLMAAHQGMCYMRTHRPDIGLLYRPDETFEVGGSKVLIDGGPSAALAVVSSGYMVHVCKQAVEKLAAAGMRCTLVDAYSLPMKVEPVLAAAAAAGGRMLVVEDNYCGGYADELAVAAAAGGNVRVSTMTCTRMPKSARTPEEILASVGLGVADIEARIRELAGRRG